MNCLKPKNKKRKEMDKVRREQDAKVTEFLSTHFSRLSKAEGAAILAASDPRKALDIIEHCKVRIKAEDEKWAKEAEDDRRKQAKITNGQ